MKKYELKYGGYGWIDNVTIENVYTILLEDEEDDKIIEMYSNDGKLIANANISYCDEAGYCEYNEHGFTGDNTPITIYTY